MLGQRVSQCDELRLAGTRMRYMTFEEQLNGTNDISAVHPLQWVLKKNEFEAENVLAKTELTRALGQIIYLNNLAKVCPTIQYHVYILSVWYFWRS